MQARKCLFCKTEVKDPKAKRCPKCGKVLQTPVQLAVTIFILISIVFLGVKGLQALFSTSQAPTTTVSTKMVKHSLTPTTDPCEQYLGTSQMVDCMKMQDALLKGNATHYPLQAKVTYDSTSLYITNTETQEWDQCTATVNETDPQGDSFQSDGFVVSPGQTDSIGWGNFVNSEGNRFNYFHTKPTTIDLDCQIGGTTDPKTGAYSGGQEHRSVFNL